jgi:hypothetical protein
VVKGHLPQLGEIPPVAHALPQVAPAATCDALTSSYQEPKLREHLMTNL